MESIKEIIALGKQCFESRQYAEAEEYLRKVLEKNVKYADVFNMMGVISQVKGSFTSATRFFQSALDVNPLYTEAIMNLAVMYNDLGEYAKAKKLYGIVGKNRAKKGHAIEPVLRGKLSNLHTDIGDIYRSIGLHDFAIDEYQKALNLNPDYFDIRTKLGQSLRENGNPAKAVKEFKAVIKGDKFYTPALIQLGVTYFTMNKNADAKRQWKLALKNDPNNEYALMYLRLCEVTSSTKSKKKVKKKAVAKKTVKKVTKKVSRKTTKKSTSTTKKNQEH